MINLLKKIFNRKVLSTFFILFFFSTSTTHASVSRYLEAKQADGLDLTKWVSGSKDYLGLFQITGWAFIDEGWGLDQTSTDGAQHGAIPTLLGFMGQTYLSKPASVPVYIAHVKEKIGIVKPAYAQTRGIDAMTPILKLWEVMRNLCYLFLTVILVIVGFMIMFRKKLDPQTAISIQYAIPKIITALILITFSYAISGLIIDISELLTRIIATVFSGTYFTVNNMNEIIAKLTNPYDPTYTANCWSDPDTCFYNFFYLIAPLFRIEGITYAIQTTIKSVAGGLGTGSATLLQGLSTVVVPVMFTVAMLQAMLKGFFMLLTAYVNIVLSTLFSPFVFLADSLGSGAAGSWFKSFLTNVLVFPVTFLLLIIAAIILSPTLPRAAGDGLFDKPWNITAGGSGTGVTTFDWYPAPLGIFWEDKTVPGSGGTSSLEFSTSLINYLIAFGMLLAIPNVNNLIKGIMEKQDSGVGANIAQTIMGAARNIPLLGNIVS